MSSESIWTLALGTVAGALASWYITHRYYVRQVRDARESERKIGYQFDIVGSRLRSIGIDVRSLIDAVKSGNDEAIEKATKDLADLEKRVRKTEVRSMFM